MDPTSAFQNVTTFTSDNFTVQTGIDIFKICIYFAIPALGLIGNRLVIFVTSYKMKTTVNSIWFLNLAIADLIFFSDYPASMQSYKSFVAYRFIMGFIIPFLIIASSYIAIGVRIKYLKKGKHHKSYRVIIAIVLAFFICWLSYHIYEFYYISANENEWSASAKEVLVKAEAVVNCLVFLSSCLNPTLYVFTCEEYKKKLKESLLVVLEMAFAEEDHLDIRVSKQIKDTAISTAADKTNFEVI